MRVVKGIVRRMVNPFWKRVRPFVYTRIDWRIANYLHLNGMAQDDRGWNQLVPSFLNAISTVQTFGRELALLKKNHDAEIARLQSEIASLRAQLEERQRLSDLELNDVAS